LEIQLKRRLTKCDTAFEEKSMEEQVEIQIDGIELPGTLHIPDGAHGVVLFAHGSGSSRLSPRNNFVAGVVQQRGIATLLFDLLTPREDQNFTRRFDIPLLTERLVGATQWLQRREETQALAIGYFGASTGSAAALNAAARLAGTVRAVVSRGGRPDLAYRALPEVQAPTLFIVGGDDGEVLDLNREAMKRLRAPHQLAVVPGATHLFEEPGALEEVARLATDWFARYLMVAG